MAQQARVRVFNQSLLDGLVAETPGEGWSPGRREAPLMSTAQRERAAQMKHLKDLEEIRTRRFERNHREAQIKAAESDRQVRGFQILSSGWRRVGAHNYFVSATPLLPSPSPTPCTYTPGAGARAHRHAEA